MHESGPPHLRNFVYSVKVNGVEYQPTVASQNKKAVNRNFANKKLFLVVW